MEQTIPQKRQIAYKVRINQIISGSFIKKEGWEPSFVIDNTGRELSRVNIMATVVMPMENDEVSRTLVIDDGTGKINIKTFNAETFIPQLEIGNLIVVIGKVREYNQEMYVIPEIIRQISPDWIAVRDKELSSVQVINQQPENKSDETINIEDIEDIQSPTEIIYNLIKEMDEGDGADIEDVIKESKNAAAEKLITNLLKDGEIFEISPGKLKVLE